MGSSYQEEFEEIFRSKVTREGSAAFLEWLSKTDFFTAPASTKFHCACPCGLVQHSVSVYRTMVERYFDPETDSEESLRSAACCTMYARRSSIRRARATSKTNRPARGRKSPII